MPEPFPKVMVNRQGARVIVRTFAEQDAATAKGYFRSLARKEEHEQQQQQKAAD